MNHFKFINLLMFALVLVCCRSVLEQDITGKSIKILYPADSAVVDFQNVLFGWEEVEGANGYEIEVVRPNFSSPEAYILDSVVVDDRLSVFLAPGDYKWRMRAINSIGETPWVEQHLVVLSSGGISGEIIEVLTPFSGLLQSSSEVNFSWAALSGAESYLLRVYENDFEVAGQLVYESIGAQLDASGSFDQGKYLWHVAAINQEDGSSLYSTLRYFDIDQTPPSAPVLLHPSTGETIGAMEFEFDWQSGEDANQGIDSLYIYELGQSSALFSEQYSSSGAVIDLSSYPAGSYHWKIVTLDAASNATSSPLRQFFLN